MCLARAGKTRLAIWIAIAAVNLAFRVAFARARSIPRGLFSLRLARAEARLRPNRSAMASACGVDLEVRWRDALTLLKKTRGKKLGSRKLCVLSPAAGVGDDEVEQWSARFQSQRALLGGKVGRQLGVETVDFTGNEIGDRGLAILAQNVFCHSTPRFLMLGGNGICDAAPLESVLANGEVFVLDMSFNRLTPTSMVRLVVAAAGAKTPKGHYLYPRDGKKPLALSVGGNGLLDVGGLASRLASELERIGRSCSDVCFVERCAPPRHYSMDAPAVHLMILATHTLLKRHSLQQLGERLLNAIGLPVHMLPLRGGGRVGLDGALPPGNWTVNQHMSATRPEGYRTAPQLRKIQNKKLPKPGDLEAALLETGLPIHVASADYTAEDEQCMTVRLGDAISVHDVECLACPGYVYATNSLTREHGWIKAGVLR